MHDADGCCTVINKQAGTVCCCKESYGKSEYEPKPICNYCKHDVSAHNGNGCTYVIDKGKGKICGCGTTYLRATKEFYVPKFGDEPVKDKPHMDIPLHKRLILMQVCMQAGYGLGHFIFDGQHYIAAYPDTSVGVFLYELIELAKEKGE
jgi:hypothetical protein